MSTNLNRMNWNDTLFDGLRKVNRNLNNGFPLTPRAELMLTRMESCLCSGNGLTRETSTVTDVSVSTYATRICKRKAQ